jgi:hypothetical protein
MLLGLPLASARDVVSFDFGWKHRTGLDAWAKPDDQPPQHPDPGTHPKEAEASYADDDWINVQLPHDGLIAAAASKEACPDGCSGKSFIPRHVLWYRKQFKLPATWAGSAVWLDFEGSFRNTTVWVNGELVSNHVCGYTPFRIRLDNITGVTMGETTTIAVFVDPDNGDSGSRDHGSGWWYEGGGIYRHAFLTRASKVHVEQDGLFAYSNLTWMYNGSYGSPSGVLHAKTTVLNDGDKPTTVCVLFNVTAADGTTVAPQSAGMTLTVSSSAVATASADLIVASPRLWSSSTPYLYTVATTLVDGSCSGDTIDSLSTRHGFRTLRYDANDGFFLNHEHFKVRGFCDHNNFAVVGMAVPDRVNLFRAQASRAVGGNGRRTSHNPPNPEMLEIYDRVGIVVMDENRLFDNNTHYIHNMGSLIKRDRNHPSVVIWSFCNEGACEGAHETGGPPFQRISTELDGTRPTLANMFTYNDLLSHTIDVQGFSHQSREKLQACHAALPHKPIFMSECCSCNTMRDEDVGCETLHDNPHKICTQPSFNARCAESNDATNASDGVNYAVGTMVWTLFDYYGEPPVGGPEVSSTYGQYDLCGFPKAAAFWYRTQWLLTISDGPDKTFPTQGKHEVHLVESWESPTAWPSTINQTTRSIHAYSSAPMIELYVNNKSQGSLPVIPMVKGPGSYAEWTKVPWTEGTLTAVARDNSGTAVAEMSRHTNKKASALGLSVDAPSKATGTGEAVLLDGHDAALIRGSVLDSEGRVMHLATNNISFRVVSGPGYVQGTGNGDPHCHEPNNAPWHSAYHGLVRAVIRVTSTAARSAHERELLASIDMGIDHKLMSQDTAPIVVEASADGFESVQMSIATSTDSSDSVLATAEAGAGQPVNFFG